MSAASDTICHVTYSFLSWFGTYCSQMVKVFSYHLAPYDLYVTKIFLCGIGIPPYAVSPKAWSSTFHPLYYPSNVCHFVLQHSTFLFSIPLILILGLLGYEMHLSICKCSLSICKCSFGHSGAQS